MILKIFGYGIKTYSRDLFNDFDAVFSILGIVELWMKGSSGSALAGFRVGHLVSGETSSRASFDSLYSAFLAVFQILSLQNWHEILDLLMQSDANKLIGLAYLIVWIVIGN